MRMITAMLGMLLLAAPAAGAAAAPDTAHASSTPVRVGPRVPGTSLHFGSTLEETVRLSGTSPGTAPDAGPGERVFSGPMRFYGLDAQAQLYFSPERNLAHAAFEVPRCTPRQRQFVEDELTRQGYQRLCTRYDEIKRVCDWSGRVFVHLDSDTVGLSARIAADLGDLTTVVPGSAVREDPRHAADMKRLQPHLADPAPILADTLSLENEVAPGKSPPPMLIHAMPAAYNDALRARGIEGTVLVLALVNLAGAVEYSTPLDGPEELWPFALEAVGHYQFGTYRVATIPTRFWVKIPVRFLQ